MSAERDFAYLCTTAIGGWGILIGGLVAQVIGVLFAGWALFSSTPAFGWSGLLLVALGMLCLYFGAGSLRGQRLDGVDARNAGS